MQDENGSREKATKRRALIICGLALLGLLATLRLLGIFGHFQRVELAVTDAADSSPVAGAMVVALYTRGCVGSDDLAETTVVTTSETSSDAKGVFVLDEANLFSSPGPKTFSLGICQFADEPDIYIAKPGYTAVKLSGELAGKTALTPQGGEEELEALERSVASFKKILADTLLAEAAPAFYGKLEREFEHLKMRYEILHKAHVDDLQEQLKRLSTKPVQKMGK